MSAVMNYNPAVIAAATEIRPKRAPKKTGHIALEALPDAAISAAQPPALPPHQEPYLTVDSLPPYQQTPETAETIDSIVSIHRERQGNIKAKTKLILQAKALLRSHLCTDADYEDDNTKQTNETAYGTQRRKLTDSASARVDKAMEEAKEDPTSPLGLMISPYLGGIAIFEVRQTLLERQMVKLAKQLPIYPWASDVKGLGDVSLATLIGECGDIGTYKSIAAVWKRLGLAVINGKAQGRPGEGATAEDWIEHGYNRSRRSVSWNARKGLILGMGLWRPMFGEDVHANENLTEYQKVFAERARYESEKLGLPIGESKTGKESYKAHVIARAMRYVEKRMIKHLYLNWRRLGQA